jgi:sulfate transport system ATP-binding protein
VAVDQTHNGGGPAFRAVVRHINAAGAQVRVELLSESGDALHVEISHERHRRLGLACGSAVYVTPRQIKVFVDDYVI